MQLTITTEYDADTHFIDLADGETMLEILTPFVDDEKPEETHEVPDAPDDGVTTFAWIRRLHRAQTIVIEAHLMRGFGYIAVDVYNYLFNTEENARTVSIQTAQHNRPGELTEQLRNLGYKGNTSLKALDGETLHAAAGDLRKESRLLGGATPGEMFVIESVYSADELRSVVVLGYANQE